MSALDPSNEDLIAEIVKNELTKLLKKSKTIPDIELQSEQIAALESLARVVYKAPPPVLKVDDTDTQALAALNAFMGVDKKS